MLYELKCYTPFLRRATLGDGDAASTAEGGRFSHVVLPPKITGAELLMLDKVSLAELFHAQETISRVSGEGGAWTLGWVSGDDDSETLDGTRRANTDSAYAKLGREMMVALMKERQEINGRILSNRAALSSAMAAARADGGDLSQVD